tara:strand:- start:1255 stop:2265 length:1011 start_codon:yes stop_codon:yes gene_type:complete
MAGWQSKSLLLIGVKKSYCAAKSGENPACNEQGRFVMTNKLFCFGAGFSARLVARTLRTEGWDVAGTTRSADKCDALIADGITPYVFADGMPVANIAKALTGVTHVLVSTPPGGDGDPVLNLHRGDLAALPSQTWIGYLSTTGVYGDRNGAAVDEDSALLPSGKRGRRRVAAEKAWFDLGMRHDLCVQSFRLAGIYGPGRNALETVRSGRARRIVKPEQVFSRIHVEDIARTVLASIARPHAGAVYNVCDDDAAPPQDVIAYACGLLGIDPPAEEDFATASLSPMAASFYEDNKRVENGRIKRELGVNLRYNSYQAGLNALLDDILRKSTGDIGGN